MSNYDEVVLPQPDEIDIRQREDAMGAYLMMFAAWGAGLPLPFLSLIASGIYYSINKKKSKFVRFHAFQSLLSQVPVSILNAGAIIWVAAILLQRRMFRDWEHFVTYVIFVGLMNLVYLIFSIIGAVKARRGEFYYFIFFGKIAFDAFYGAGAEEDREEVKHNVPPKGY
ncbi:MAG: DUF4870 domain-containing protein [Candidatus Aminicenantes bacterium]|nr:DUF4870 domain-containing protein [Candidatus Aminicenantes bacterium]